MQLVCIQKPSDADISGRNLDKKKHDTEHYCKVHESQCAYKRDESYDMVSNHLFVQWCKSAHNRTDTECVEHKVATGVDKGPNMEIAGRVQALVIIENSLSMTTDIEHGEPGEYNCSDGVHGRYNVCSVFGLLLAFEFLVAIVQSVHDYVE